MDTLVGPSCRTRVAIKMDASNAIHEPNATAMHRRPTKLCQALMPVLSCAMSWVSDLASAFGLPAGAATIAAAMYAACVAAEKVARREALIDISAVLKDPTLIGSVRPSAIIERVFNWTFGERHLSLKCITRSIFATIIFVFAIMLTLDLSIHISAFTTSWFYLPIGEIILTMIFAFITDYLSLKKTRVIIQMMSFSKHAVFLVPMDILLSILISVFCFVVFDCVDAAVIYHYHNLPSVVLYQLMLNLTWALSPSTLYYPLYVPLFFSTLFTSVWTMLILVSTGVIKILSPLHRFVTWFFDIEKHPVQAIGIVAGALMIAGSLVLSFVRTVL
jgi:hypothetical protein